MGEVPAIVFVAKNNFKSVHTDATLMHWCMRVSLKTISKKYCVESNNDYSN